MQIRSILQAIERFDGAAFHGLRQRQACEVRIAVDQHRAGAASALAATELGSHVADGIAQDGQQIGAAIDEHGDIAAIVTKLQGGLGHGLSYTWPETWPVSRRRRWTPTTSRRYQALASESLTGEVPSVA